MASVHLFYFSLPLVFYYCHLHVPSLQFDFSVFDHSAHPEENVFTDKKFPEMKGNYESVEQNGMFFG